MLGRSPKLDGDQSSGRGPRLGGKFSLGGAPMPGIDQGQGTGPKLDGNQSWMRSKGSWISIYRKRPKAVWSSKTTKRHTSRKRPA